MKTYWISKYALTDGIRPAKDSARLSDGYVVESTWGVFRIGTNAHETFEAAAEAAETMRVRKIASLKKQLAKMEKLTFQHPAAQAKE